MKDEFEKDSICIVFEENLKRSAAYKDGLIKKNT